MISKFKAKIQRGLWLYKSAGLNLFELFNLLINKLIFAITKIYYSTESQIKQGKWNMISGYKKFIPESQKNSKPKYALLAYLPEAFYKENYIGKIKFYFSNNGCPLNIARALNELGYEVDIIGNDETGFFPTRNYDIAIFHNIKLLDVYKKRLSPQTKIYYFEVVAYWRTVLDKVKKSYAAFNSRHGIDATSLDFELYKKMEAEGEAYDSGIELADFKIVLGDQLVNSFGHFKNVFLTTSAVMPDPEFKKDLSPDNLEKGKNSFVFFGGSSHNLRKGLDLLIEAFLNTPYHLYVCASVNDFLVDVYKLKGHSNIHLIGYQKQGTKKFYDLINSCNFVIHASRAEGIPGGVLDTMKYGLIPLVSTECNIVNAGKIGMLFKDSSVSEIKSAIEFVTKQNTGWYKEHSLMSIEEVQKNYSLESFREDLKKAFMASKKL